MFHISMHKLTVNFTDDGLTIHRNPAPGEEAAEPIKFDGDEAGELMACMVMTPVNFTDDGLTIHRNPAPGEKAAEPIEFDGDEAAELMACMVMAAEGAKSFPYL